MKVKLEDICERDSSSVKLSDVIDKQGDYPIYGAAGYIGSVDFYHQEKAYVAVVKDGAGIGRATIHPAKSSVIGTMQYLIPKENVLPEYLYYVVKHMHLEKYYTGATIPHIYFKDYKNEVFNLSTLKEQDEIVNILGKVEKIIEVYQKVLIKLDDLIKARFVELFGECKNSVRLGDCCEVHARIGWQALTRDEHMKTGDYMLITGTDFKNGEINYSTCVYVAKERYEMDKHIILRDNDVLITKDGTIGKVAIVHNLPKPATLNAGVFVVRPDERFNKEYIANVFKGPLFSDYVEASKTGATIKHLNQKHLVEFMIPVPSLDEQEAFAQFIQQTDKSKVEVQKSLNKMQLLFDSLMQEYFG